MGKRTRREFLEQIIQGAVAGGAALTVLQSKNLPALQKNPAALPQQRHYAAGHFGLELDGVFAGWVESVEGGHAVQSLKGSNQLPVNTKTGAMPAEEITLKLGTGMSKTMYDWIRATFENKHSRKNGAIVAADYDFKEMERLTFSEGLITEIGFPALDASSKDAAHLTLKIAPSALQRSTVQVLHPAPMPGHVQKKWLPSNFRLQITGLPTACQHVNKIEAIVVRQQPATLVITFPESHARELYEWEKETVHGNMEPARRREGTLDYLAEDLQSKLFSIDFHGLGIFKLTPDKTEAGSENIRHVKAELRCERMQFTYGNVWG